MAVVSVTIVALAAMGAPVSAAPPGSDETPPPAATQNEPPPAVEPVPPAEQAPPAAAPPEQIVPPDQAAQTLSPDAQTALDALAIAPDVDMVARATKGLSVEVMRPGFVKAAAHRDERVRTMTQKVIAKQSIDEYLDLVTAAFGDRAPGVVSAAASAWLELRGRRGIAELEPLLAHPSVAVRCHVATLLGEVRGRKARAPLIARLDTARDPEERACLLTVLVKRGDKGAAASAVPLLENPDTRAMGVAALSGSARAAFAALDTGLGKEPGEGLLIGAFAVAEVHGETGARWVTSLVSHPSGAVRRSAIAWLTARMDQPAIAKLLHRAAEASEPAARARVIRALAEKDAKALVSDARGWLTDDAPEVRAAAADVFAKAPRRSDASRLLRAYQDERLKASPFNLPVRVSLLRALGAVGDADFVPVLVDAFNQKGEEQAAIDALVAIGSPSVRTLLLVVKVGDTDRIPYALEALARIGSGVGDAAAGLFRHPREIVRKLGRDLMAASADPGSVKLLAQLLRSEQLEDPIPVIEAVATFDTPEAVDLLIEASGDANPAVRVAAVRGLAETHTRSDAVVGAVRKLLETDTDQEVRIESIDAMFRLGAPGLGRLLTRLVQYDAPEVRMAAYRVMGWIGAYDSATAIAVGIPNASPPMQEVMFEALARITRNPDLRAARSIQSWAAGIARGLAPGVRGVWQSTGGNAPLHYRVAGSGRVVVGLAGAYSGEVLIPLLDRFSSGSVRTVALDGRGRGRTPLGGTAPSLQSELSDLETLRASLETEKMDLVAYDLGAYVAVAYALVHPERVRSITWLAAPPAMREVGVAARGASRLSGRWADELAELDEKHAWFAPAAYQTWRAVALSPGLVAKPADAPLVAADTFGAVADHHIRRSEPVDLLRAAETLKAKGIQLVIAVGKQTPMTPGDQSRLRRLADEFANVRFVEVPGAGHFPHLEESGVTASAVKAALR